MSKPKGPSSYTLSTASSSACQNVRGCSLGNSSHRAQPNVQRCTGGGERNFTCNTCRKSFVSNQALSGHHNVHRNKPPKRGTDNLSLGQPHKSSPAAAAPTTLHRRPSNPPLPALPPFAPRGKEVVYAPYHVLAHSGLAVSTGGTSTGAVAVTNVDTPMVHTGVAHVVPVAVSVSVMVKGTGRGLLISSSETTTTDPNTRALRNGGEARAHQEVDLELRLGWK
ncbi:hypothetical protein Ancab_013728 [Ancistrocladus abbreviatus]